jgi:hypothetical protein
VRTYLHPQDFDHKQPMIEDLSLIRRFKSYVGLSRTFHKLQKLLRDFAFTDIAETDKHVDWDNARTITI